MKLQDANTVLAAERLRNYLVRNYAVISANYPEVAGLEPANAADFLLHLQNTGRILIELIHESPARAICRIIELDSVTD